MRWLTERVFNRYDTVWLMLAAVLFDNREWAWGIVAVLFGAITSAVLEDVAKSSRKWEPK